MLAANGVLPVETQKRISKGRVMARTVRTRRSKSPPSTPLAALLYKYRTSGSQTVLRIHDSRAAHPSELLQLNWAAERGITEPVEVTQTHSRVSETRSSTTARRTASRWASPANEIVGGSVADLEPLAGTRQYQQPLHNPASELEIPRIGLPPAIGGADGGGSRAGVGAACRSHDPHAGAMLTGRFWKRFTPRACGARSWPA